ncbi:MAG: hypothetical protein KAT41_06360, partial [Candidatus Marinimicrobia bacterium]|nr:hypothetical protein [Candidatus Neomarinimicrobiota bacterium]
NKEVDPMMAFGTNLGIGFKYNLMSTVGKPVEIDLRFTQNLFLMGDVTDTNDSNITSGGPDYSHGENGFLLGIAYPF